MMPSVCYHKPAADQCVIISRQRNTLPDHNKHTDVMMPALPYERLVLQDIHSYESEFPAAAMKRKDTDFRSYEQTFN